MGGARLSRRAPRRPGNPRDAALSDPRMLPSFDPPACPATRPETELVVVVWKAEFALGVYEEGALLTGPDGAPACFPVALGAEPAGGKRERGDERTPEGEFRITHRNPRSAFTLSLGLDYPRAQDAVAAFAEGRIGAEVRDRVVAADVAGRMPPRDTPLGGDIFLHGGGAAPRDWTDGCVALDDDAIRWLYAKAGPGTRVLVLP